MDPCVHTCAQFSTHLTTQSTPANAAPEWAKLSEPLKTLLDQLTHHPAMADNLQQTYSRCANSRTNIFYMWQFIGWTLSHLYMVNPTLENLSRGENKPWREAKGRASYAKMLILDDEPGMLDMMIEAMYSEQKGLHHEFGEDILEVAKGLD